MSLCETACAWRRTDSVSAIAPTHRLHPYYLVYSGEWGEIVANHMEAKKVLDLLGLACKGRSEPLAEVCRPFDAETQGGREMSRSSNLLAEAIRSMVELKEEKDLDSLFSGGGMTALAHAISSWRERRDDLIRPAASPRRNKRNRVLIALRHTRTP